MRVSIDLESCSLAFGDARVSSPSTPSLGLPAEEWTSSASWLAQDDGDRRVRKEDVRALIALLPGDGNSAPSQAQAARVLTASATVTPFLRLRGRRWAGIAIDRPAILCGGYGRALQRRTP